MTFSILKVPATIMCLMKLHNFCIDNDSRSTSGSTEADKRYINSEVRRNGKRTDTPITLGSHGTPEELLWSGHHFKDCTRRHRPTPVLPQSVTTPMHHMRTQVALKDLARPKVNKYGKKKRD